MTKLLQTFVVLLKYATLPAPIIFCFILDWRVLASFLLENKYSFFWFIPHVDQIEKNTNAFESNLNFVFF